MSAISHVKELQKTQQQDPKLFFEKLKEKFGSLPEVEEMLSDPELICHFTKSTKKKSSPPPEERQGVYNSVKCDARVWKEKPKSGGLGYDNIQCHAKKAGGCDGLCKKHFNLLNQEKLWLGRVTEKRPTNPVHPTAGEKAWCTDEDGKEVVKEKKQRKTSSKPKNTKKKKKDDYSIEELRAMLSKKEEEESVKEEPVKEEPVKEEPVKEEEEPVKEEDEEEEDDNPIIMIDGTEYQHNKEDNTIIRTDDFEEVGVWNEVTGEVDFHSGDEE